MRQRFFERLRKVVIPSLLTGLAMAALAVAAAGQQAPQSVFGEVIDVRVVNLEAVVTGQGQRVTGLGPEDFVLTVDGQPVAIDYFTEVASGVAVDQGEHAGGVMVPALDPGKPVGTRYLLFIDDFFSLKPRRNLVLRSVIEQLASLEPEDHMAIVAYNGQKLDVLATWSSPGPQLERVLEAAMARPTGGMRQRVEGRLYLGTASPGPDPVPSTTSPNPDGAVESGADLGSEDRGEFLGFSQLRGGRLGTTQGLRTEEEQAAAWLTERVVRVVTAVTAAQRTFAQAPGRKVMLLMSGGWPDNPVDWILRDTDRFESSRADERNKIYGPLIDTANRLSYTLYPIDVPGTSHPASSVSIQRATLRRLAHETGGKPILAGDSLRALEKTATDTRSYYWIGFVPKWRGDDASHQIRIKVRRKGVEVRTRRTFSDLSREREVTMQVEGALRLGEWPSSAAFPTRLGGVGKAGRGKVEVLLEMLIPVSELTFLPHKGRYVAEVEQRVAVEDEAGTSTDIPVVPVRITLEEPPEAGEMQRWETRIKIRQQKHEVVISFYDIASGKLLFSRLEVDPSAP